MDLRRLRSRRPACRRRLYTLIETAKRNDVDPRAWLAGALRGINDHPGARLDELLPWNGKAAAEPAIAACPTNPRIIMRKRRRSRSPPDAYAAPALPWFALIPRVIFEIILI